MASSAAGPAIPRSRWVAPGRGPPGFRPEEKPIMSSREKTPDMTPPAPAGTPCPSPAVIFMPPPALQVTFSRPAGQPPRLRVHAPAAAGPGRPAAGAVPAAGPDEAPGDPIFQGLAG